MSHASAGARHAQVRAARVVRAAGAALLLYSYLWGLWSDQRGVRLALVDETREWVSRPLGIGEDGGPLGIMLLLLASGFTSVRASGAGRSVRDRLVRVYLPLVVGAAVAAALLLAGGDVLAGRDTGELSPAGAFGDVGLINYLAPGAAPVLALGWVVCVELITTLTGAVISRSGGRAVWWTPLAQLAVVGVLAAFCDPSSPLALLLCFWPLAVIGQLVASGTGGAAPLWPLVLAGLAAWGLVAWTERAFPDLEGWWYGLTACYAALFFTALVRADLGSTRRSVGDWFASRSRWILVFTGTIGWALASALSALPPLLALVIASAATLLASECGHRASTALRTAPVRGQA
ncbi:hypothetical protein [Umezawaea beigongshangensis]|uniref:hypothetical protein n=1 Tax=Umezawaea beigongshangensis TaxID=2780383 RepID=UPI0018F266B8|nr:hypothetical protein [Umezawaea beigongshangensis]